MQDLTPSPRVVLQDLTPSPISCAVLKKKPHPLQEGALDLNFTGLRRDYSIED